jgi:hypothetical protein
LIVFNLDEIAARWQIPVERVNHFITDLGMPVSDEERGKWFSEHLYLILKEKRQAFEASLFALPLRPEPVKPLA